MEKSVRLLTEKELDSAFDLVDRINDILLGQSPNTAFTALSIVIGTGFANYPEIPFEVNMESIKKIVRQQYDNELQISKKGFN